MAKTVRIRHAEVFALTVGQGMSFLARLVIYAWRTICLAYTRLRWPALSQRPALLLHYETPAQRQAYSGASGFSLVGAVPAQANAGTKILVIIPFRDKWELTDACVSTLKKQDFAGAEVLALLVDNGSTEPATLAGLERLLAEVPTDKLRFALHKFDIPFNYSRLNNLAVQAGADFGADYYLLLNNDVYFTESGTVAAMAKFLSGTPKAASVGCSLLYPDRTIQHLFIYVGCKIVGAHPYKGRLLDLTDPWCREPRPVGAATAALLMVRARDYLGVGGFDESLPSCYQDVDLALKFLDLGQTNWVIPRLTAIHAETQTRRPDHHWSEVEYMQDKWGKKLTENAYISTKFCRWSEQIALALGEGAYPWHWLAKQDSK